MNSAISTATESRSPGASDAGGSRGSARGQPLARDRVELCVIAFRGPVDDTSGRGGPLGSRWQTAARSTRSLEVNG